MTPSQTPSQTIGPFFSYALTSDENGRPLIASNRIHAPSGTEIRIEGKVLDGDGKPVSDAMLEIWQADADGRLTAAHDRANLNFLGFARAATDQDGNYIFETVKPGRTKNQDNILQAPYINLTVFARGILGQLHTRIYFADEKSNDKDPVLAIIQDPDRRTTLIAVPDSDWSDHTKYQFDIHLQGDAETVFFQWS